MKIISITALLIVLSAMPVIAADGVINVQSSFSVAETTTRLQKILTDKGMTIFKQINHSQGARKVGITLRPTELVIFGNPKVGSPLMQCQQSIAIDLPQKALVWQDDQAKVWISYNNPRYLAQRHHISDCEKTIEKVGKALAGISRAAASK